MLCAWRVLQLGSKGRAQRSMQRLAKAELGLPVVDLWTSLLQEQVCGTQPVARCDGSQRAR